jgi:TRAP-type C4-dicarboxylate transport system permease small subunit
MTDLVLKCIYRTSKWIYTLAGITLIFIMIVTVTDVLLRTLGRPIVGVYELVGFSGAVVIGFSIPFVSWVRGHIYVDFLVLKLSPTARRIFHLSTRAMALALFLMIGWNLFKVGNDLWKSGEVSPTLQMPFYPIVYGVGVSCLIQCLVLLADMVKIRRGQYE